MKKSETYYLKDGKLDLSLLNEEIHPELQPIIYHTIKRTTERPIKVEGQEPNIKEKLYGSLETYELLKEMGEYLSEGLDSAEEELTESEAEITEEPVRVEWEYEYEEEIEDLIIGPDLMVWEYEEENREIEELQVVMCDNVIVPSEILSFQVSEEDKVLMKQYEKPDQVTTEEDVTQKKISKIQQFREYQTKLLEGRILTEDIISQKGIIIGRAGERITANLLGHAKEEDMLIKIILKYL